MSRKIFFYCLFLFFTSSVYAQSTPSSPTAASVCTRPLVVGWTDYPPFQRSQAQLRATIPTGLEIELLTKIGKNIGCTFIYKKTPVSRQIHDLNAGIIDLVFSADERPQIIKNTYASIPYRTKVIRLFVRKNEVPRFKITTLSDLNDTAIVLGTKRGFYHGPEFEAAYKDPSFRAHVDENNYYIMNLMKLFYGRIDGVLMESPVEREFQQHTNFAQLITIHPFILYKGPVRILFSKKTMTPAIVNAFNAQITHLEKSNELKALFIKYSIDSQ